MKVCNGYVKCNLLIAVYSTLIFSFNYKNFQSGTLLGQVFERKIGPAAFQNYDVNSGIKNLFLFLLVILPLAFFISLFIFTKIAALAQKRMVDGSILDAVNKFIFVSLIPFLLEYMGKLETEEGMNSLYLNLFFIFLSCYMYLLIRDKEEMSVSDLKWMIGLSVVMSYIVETIVAGMEVTIPRYVFYFCMFFILLHAMNSCLDANRSSIIKSSTVPFFYSMILYAAALEGVVILNQNNIMIGNVAVVIGGVFLLVILGSVVLYYFSVKLSYDEWVNWGLLLSYVFWAALPAIQVDNVTVDFFEHSNAAVSLSQLVLFYKIPYVETVSAHVASDWLPGLIYYCLNKDYNGALISTSSPYWNIFMIFWILILYAIVSKCMKKEEALLICLVLPFPSYSRGWGTMGILSIAALSMICKEKVTICNFVLFWVLLALSVLFKVDTGIAYGIAAVIAYLIVYLLNKKQLEIKKLVGTFFGVVGCTGIVYLGICIVKKVQPINKIREFIAIFGSSNEIWSNGRMDALQKTQFAIIYFIVPIAVLVLLIIMTYAILKKRLSGAGCYIVMVYAFGISYFLNLQRIVVRHNLREVGFEIRMTFTAVIFLALALYVLVDKWKLYCFAALFGMMIMIFNIDDKRVPKNNLLNLANANFEEGRVVSKYHFDKKIERTQWSEESIDVYQGIAEEINSLLAENETFLDFSNQSILYSILKKESPVYTAQTLGLMAGDYTQECFIKELADKQIPVAISAVDSNLNCGIGIDGFQHSYRQYRISEYLNQNYIPMETVDGFALWIKNDRKDLMEKVINKYKEIPISSDLEKNDLVLKEKEDCYELQAVGSKPYLSDIKIGSAVDADGYTIFLKYKSSQEGNMKLFYRNSLEEDYSEEKCIISEIQKGEGMVSFTVDAYERYIRLGIPENSVVDIVSIGYGKTGCILCFYDYGQKEELHMYSLGHIPYLWGMQDYKKAYENQSLYQWDRLEEDMSLSFDFDKNVFSQSVYLKICMVADYESSVEVALGNETDDFEQKMKYIFTVSPGKNIYLLRISADSYWQEGEVDKIYFDLPKEVYVGNVSLLEGD